MSLSLEGDRPLPSRAWKRSASIVAMVLDVRLGPPGLGQGTQTPAQTYLCLVTVV